MTMLRLLLGTVATGLAVEFALIPFALYHSTRPAFTALPRT